MQTVELVFALMGCMAVLVAIARRVDIPYPIVLVVGGLAISLIPGIPPVELDPELGGDARDRLAGGRPLAAGGLPRARPADLPRLGHEQRCKGASLGEGAVVRIKRYHIEHSTQVAASPETVWQEVTQVDIAAFPHPAYLAILGIPKPLRADLLRPGVGGVRVAYFSNSRRFSQEISEWQPPERYAFTFTADPGFRVAYILDLATGPFRMVAGAYKLRRTTHGTALTLSSEYVLRGALGACLHVPVRLVLHLFQTYLLRGIRANAEGAARRRT